MKEFLKKLGQDVASKTIVTWGLPGLVVGLSLLFPKVRDPIWNYLTGSHSLNGVLVFVLGILAVPTLILLLRRLFRPAHRRKYRQDSIDGMRWRWDYQKGKIANLRAHCLRETPSGKECGVRLKLTPHAVIPNSSPAVAGTTIYCPGCNHTFAIANALDIHDDEERKIERWIETGDWKTRLNPPAIIANGPTFPLGFHPAASKAGRPEKSTKTSSLALPPKPPTPPKKQPGRPDNALLEEMVATVEKASLFHRSEVEKSFEGIEVELVGKLDNIHRRSRFLTAVLITKSGIRARCSAADPNDKTLIAATEGTYVRVAGTAKVVSGKYSVELTGCTYEIVR